MMSFHAGKQLSGQNDVQSAVHVPMVYERVPSEPAHWEYRVLTVDTREEDLPDAVQLNELGAQGWLLVGILNQGARGRNSWGDEGKMTREYVSHLLEQGTPGRSPQVNYYFVRQKSE